jgi:translation initiation factor 1A
MPRGKGGKKKGGRHDGGRGASQAPVRELVLADECQVYGVALKALGDRHFNVACQDKAIRRCKVRGKMFKRVWIQVGDTVLVALREFADKEGDIVEKFTPDQVRVMRREGILLMEGQTDAKAEEDDDAKAEDLFDFEAL